MEEHYMKFTERALHEDIHKGIKKAGFTTMLPVQQQTFNHILDNQKDVCVQSQTGTGKTAAFLISIFQLLLTQEFFKKKKALIVAPTRELAVQITEEAQLLGHYLDLRIGCFYGGVGFAKQEALLKDGVDIIIGTPGRLLDFNQQRKLDLRKIGILIIDEADRLFDMGFLPDIRRMIKKMPPYTERRTMLFSATLDTRVQELSWEYMNEPAKVEIAPEQLTVENVCQELYHVEQSEKMRLLLGILKKENPENALIFTNTKHMAYEVSQRLVHNGYNCRYIMGDLPQNKRLQVIEGVKSGKIKYLVATEVAARGLHIDDLSLVVNYDLPAERESYVHRIGRTARAGKSGKAITFACDKYVYGLEAIESFTNMKIPVLWADDDIFVQDKSAGKTFRQPKAGREPLREKVTRAHSRRHSSAEDKRPKKTHKAPSAARSSDTKRHKNNTSSPTHPSATKVRSLPRRNHTKKSARTHTISPPGRNSTPEERIVYYQKKYGENFTSVPHAVAHTVTHVDPTEKKSFLRKIINRLVK
jgi:ATP-dependent RNA helicase RhlB